MTIINLSSSATAWSGPTSRSSEKLTIGKARLPYRAVNLIKIGVHYETEGIHDSIGGGIMFPKSDLLPVLSELIENHADHLSEHDKAELILLLSKDTN